ncbi:DUF935 family protein [Formicincola oecophyllae]|uniref:DUF935 family protein n=1 Tax=Formicincola oecophyllae TaxID=2558361 RepID=A0A4Y6UBP1_9PROT|nr:DUF935 family protein [Formicincola oecophyllae]QDH13821.1 DUF935 family protein [Formicincola oecophyllae]
MIPRKRLLNAQGQPVDAQGAPHSSTQPLRQDVMGPRVIGDRPATLDHLGLTQASPDVVANLLASAAQGESRDWQVFCELIEERDLHYLGVLTTRKRAVAQLPITVDDAGPSELQKRQGDFVRTWLEKGIFQRAMFDILDAIAKGFSVHEIVWHCEAANYWPSQLVFRPQRFFEVSYQDGESIYLRAMESQATPALEDATPELMRQPLDPRRALVHRHPSWSGLQLRQGLTRAIAFNSLFKLYSSRDWGVFVQAFGLPIRVGKYDNGSSENDRNVLWKAVTDLAGAMACTMPESMNIEFIEPKGTTASDVHEKRCKWLDEQTSKAVLGQTGTTDARTGTHAAAQTHRLVQEDIERADATLLAHTLNSQLVKQMIDLSFGPPKDGRYPVASIGRPDEAPLETVLDAIAKAGPQGLKVKADELLARLNMTPPGKGDAVVGLMAQPQPAQPAEDTAPETRPGKVTPAHVPPVTDQDPPAPAAGQEQTLHARLGALVSRHAQSQPAILDMLSNSLANEASTAWDQMTGPVRAAIESAHSLEELQQVLEEMRLPDDQFQEAMQQGLLAAELAGEASILAGLGVGR